MSNDQVAKKILVIDDNDDLRDLSIISLSSAGYIVFNASNGKEGQEQMEIVSPNLIVLDMIMPVLDGMGFLYWLRQTVKLDTPVLALTSLPQANIESQALSFGASDILYKPFSPDDLVEHVQRLLW